MDAFESIVATILERQGYWARSNVKVNLTREEKQAIGRSSSPRWEIDLVAYKAVKNQVLAVECKSYLDSYGVKYSDIANPDKKSRYKLFTDATLRRIVLGRLCTELVEVGFCCPQPEVKLCLVAGKIYGKPEPLRQLFDQNGWLLWDVKFLREQLGGLAQAGYDNQVASMVAKILLRGEVDEA